MKKEDKNNILFGIIVIVVLQIVIIIFGVLITEKVIDKFETIKDCSIEYKEGYDEGHHKGIEECAVEYCELKLYSDICKRTVRINPDGSKTVTIDSKECPGAFKDQLLA